MDWKYVDTDGNPSKPGMYWVTLIYPEMKQDGGGWKPTGKILAEVDTRCFEDFDKNPDFKSWKMCDQPDSGLAWSEECGSSQNEKVWAWAEYENPSFPERMPDGVEKYSGDN